MPKIEGKVLEILGVIELNHAIGFIAELKIEDGKKIKVQKHFFGIKEEIDSLIERG